MLSHHLVAGLVTSDSLCEDATDQLDALVVTAAAMLPGYDEEHGTQFAFDLQNLIEDTLEVSAMPCPAPTVHRNRSPKGLPVAIDWFSEDFLLNTCRYVLQISTSPTTVMLSSSFSLDLAMQG